ncbi:acrosin-like isoform 2-T2 [Discoglossus pictus]
MFSLSGSSSVSASSMDNMQRHQVGCGSRPRVDREAPATEFLDNGDVFPGTWPWVVSIQEPSGAFYEHVCGGTIFNAEWVVSAAHCFRGEENNIYSWRVVSGASQLSELGTEAQMSKVKRLLVHKKYQPTIDSDDIALIELETPLVFNDYTQPACFPPREMVVEQLFPCVISGWGSFEEEDSEPSDIMQQAKVDIISLETCNSSYWYDGAIGIYNLCAEYQKGVDHICQDDSGGPLMCKVRSTNIYYVVGITSWGKGCALAESPGVYTSTQYFLQWILQSIPNEGTLAPARTAQVTRSPNAGIEHVTIMESMRISTQSGPGGSVINIDRRILSKTIDEYQPIFQRYLKYQPLLHGPMVWEQKKRL